MTIYFVDPLNGSDSNDGSSMAKAFRSTAKSETVVAAGDTVKFLATHAESLTGTNTITLSTSGTSFSPIYWQGCDSSGNALPDGSYYTIDGSEMSSGSDMINTGAKTNRRMRNMLFANAKRFGVACTADPAYTIILELCSITNPATACFGSSTYYTGYGYEAINSIFTGSGAGGTQRFSCNNIGVANRSEVSCIACSIAFFNTVFTQDASNGVGLVYGNIFANNGTVLPGSIYSQGQFIQDNVFYGNSYCIGVCDRTVAGGGRFDSIIGNTFVNNLKCIDGIDATVSTVINAYNHYFNNASNYSGGSVVAGSHEIGGDPLFNSPGMLDFRLKSGSPLIGSGPRGLNIAGLTQISGGSGVPVIGEGLVF
jgi:hypothetical protein